MKAGLCAGRTPATLSQIAYPIAPRENPAATTLTLRWYFTLFGSFAVLADIGPSIVLLQAVQEASEQWLRDVSEPCSVLIPGSHHSCERDTLDPKCGLRRSCVSTDWIVWKVGWAEVAAVLLPRVCHLGLCVHQEGGGGEKHMYCPEQREVKGKVWRFRQEQVCCMKKGCSQVNWFVS